MNAWWSEILRCPICGATISREGMSLFCGGARRHCFDLSAAGYVNLAPARAAGGGDDAALIAARSAFLSGGAYRPIADAVVALLREFAAGDRVIDAGSGEGYYTLRMAEEGFFSLGFDLSKNGVKHAARAARGQERALFAVSGIFDLPVADASVDAVVSLFAPVAEKEFCRVLKKGGVLIVAGAGAEHLFELKRVLYDTPYPNEPRADLPVGMEELAKRNVRFSMDLAGDALQALFSMTPYFYRTKAAGRERLAALSALTVSADVDFFVYRKGQ